jgi:hypothetical protein
MGSRDSIKSVLAGVGVAAISASLLHSAFVAIKSYKRKTAAADVEEYPPDAMNPLLVSTPFLNFVRTLLSLPRFELHFSPWK